MNDSLIFGEWCEVGDPGPRVSLAWYVRRNVVEGGVSWTRLCGLLLVPS